MVARLLLGVVSVAATTHSAPSRWKPTWLMNESTIILWRNATGLQPVEQFAGYGVVMLDWSHAAGRWINDFTPMDNGKALSEECAAVKAANPAAKCVVYRNSVKALNQFADVGAKVDDPDAAGFFLPFRKGATSPTECWCDSVAANVLICKNRSASDAHVPMCDGADKTKCNTLLYHDSRQIPHVPGHNWMNNTYQPFENLSCTNSGGSCDCGASPCGEYLFDHRNKTMQQWLVNDYFGGAGCLGDDNVDGLILDDYWTGGSGGSGGSGGGPSEENPYAVQDMGLTATEVTDVAGNWSASLALLQAVVERKGKYIVPTYAGDSMSTRSHNHTQCAERMRELGCTPHAAATGPMVFTVRFNHTPTATLGLTPIDATLDVAYYLLGRGPVAWIGSGYVLGWALALQYNVAANRPISIADLRYEGFDKDYGVPVGQCEEVGGAGTEVFSRRWSKATAVLDCKHFNASIQMLDT